MNGLKTVGGCFNVDLSVVFDDFEPFVNQNDYQSAIEWISAFLRYQM